ncbi:MAG: hypothetical protein KDH15_19630 [Rhodocyclaceae bacterium]|nr:hypothetical protein [Rhodocyclaceae bacterium]
MKMRLLLVALAAVMSTSAWARHCPKDMKAIDAALAEHPQLSAEEMDEVKKLRAEGEELHKAGKHPESEASLAKAMKMLGI